MKEEMKSGNEARGDTPSLRDQGTKRSRVRTRALLTLASAAVAVISGLTIVAAQPASASTVNGVLTITNADGTGTYVPSGASTTPFTVTLPPNAACDGDTATGGFHVYSYLVPEGTDVTTLTFTGDAPPSQSYGFLNNAGVYYGPVNTAVTTGQIIGIPNNFEWASYATDNLVPTLLAGGTTPGTWEAGLLCSNSSGAVTDNWNTEITFTASGSDPNGFVWSAIPGPSGDQVSTITSANTSTFTEGVGGTFTPTATGTPTPTITENGALPNGVTFTGGALTGTPTATGSFPITFTATNGIGNPDVQNFTLTVGAAQVAPAITSADSTGFIVGAAGSFTVTATGTPTPTFSETGTLPTGVTFTGGVLSGTPAAGTGGTYPLTITATNGVNPDATQSFTLTVGSAPNITSANHTTFTVGSAGTFTPTVTGTPTPAVSETGALPTGVTFAGGVLSGTPAAGTGGTYSITLTATNGITPDATQGFTLTVDGPPAITSANSTSFIVGTAGTFTVTATGLPTPTISESGTLPTGVTFSGGVLSGTPGVGTAGNYPITFTATNAINPDATQSFTLSVGSPPAFTSANNTTFTVGSAGTFTPTATGTPTPAISESGTLPSGVTFAAGVLSGTPAAGTGGTFSITLTATNGITPNATQGFTLTVNQAPAITSANSTSFVVGTAGTFTVASTGFPDPTISDSGTLPTGVTFSAGVLSGTPGAGTAGDYSITITAANGVSPDATQSFTLHVGSPPAITSVNHTTFTVGSAGTFTATATGTPTPTISESGTLPSGVTFASGVLSGTPAAGTGGTYLITITANNGIGNPVNQSFTLTVDAPPTITSANSTSFVVGTSGTFTVATAGFPVPTISESGALPTGVTLTSGGVLSGTPTAGTAGAYSISITATNGIGSNATQSFTLTVVIPPLVISTASLPGGTAGTPYAWTLAATGGSGPYAWSIAAGSLPAGLALDAATGAISGTPTTVATSSFTVRVTDADTTSTTKALSIAVASSVIPPNAGSMPLPVVDIAPTPDGKGYWLVNGAGDISPHGSAQNYGSLAGMALGAPIVAMAPTPSGKGYWLVASDGGVFSFGDAAFYGSMGGQHLNAPIVGVAATASGQGYWLVASDGGIFSFGDAAFHGSMGGQHLNQPIVGMTSDAGSGGYWLVASDGGIFSFGDAAFHGSMGGQRLNRPIVGMAADPGSGGYWLVASDGGVFSFGDAVFHGSGAAIPVAGPVTGIAVSSSTPGYWLGSSGGGVYTFGPSFYGAG
jgi:large repetitive protein